MSEPRAATTAGAGRKPAAVLLLAFNRPDLLAQVLAAVQKSAPREVFVAVDGPRAGNADDAALCAQVRQLAEKITWASHLHLKFEASNLGCRAAVISAIDWALAAVPELIIIEDDCLPEPSFFTLCDELLARYRDDTRVLQIAGSNWGAGSARYAGYSYAFTSFAPVWGWATWRRAWALYDVQLESWPRVKATGLAQGFALSPRFRRLLERDWALVRSGGGTWDHQWQYTVLRHHGLSVSPCRNLVVNLGFRPDGTQVRLADRVFSRLGSQALSLPLHHPPEVARNASVEAVFETIYWQKLGWPGRAYRKLVNTPVLGSGIRKLVRRLLPRPS